MDRRCPRVAGVSVVFEDLHEVALNRFDDAARSVKREHPPQILPLAMFIEIDDSRQRSCRRERPAFDEVYPQRQTDVLGNGELKRLQKRVAEVRVAEEESPFGFVRLLTSATCGFEDALF